MNEEVIKVNHLSKSFGKHVVLRDIDFSVSTGDVTCIIGASGSGKSTLLRCMNLLETPTTGEILYHGKNIADGHTDAAGYRAKVGMVFQSFNLFDNLTVKDNLTIAPVKILKKSKEEAVKKAQEYLDTFGIGDKMDSYPHQLSGGQKQRVAIVRSMMMEPDVMLFDEPTSALDPEMIKEVLDAIRRLADMGMTMVIVTHEIGFAREVSNRMLFLEKAKIRVDAPTEEFFTNTEDERLNQFLSVILKH